MLNNYEDRRGLSYSGLKKADDDELLTDIMWLPGDESLVMKICVCHENRCSRWLDLVINKLDEHTSCIILLI